MRYVKALGLATVVAAALMGFVGSSTASATTLTKETGGILTTGSEVHIVNEGLVTLTASPLTNECTESTIKGEVTKETGAAVEVKIDTMTWGGCPCEVKTVTGGTLTITVIGTGPDGTVAMKNTEITFACETSFGSAHCIFKANATGTTLGTLTGSKTTGATATMDVESGEFPSQKKGFLCAEKARLDGKWKISTPDVLNVIS
jgi:hypothetical protein